ncbi:MAG: hypothetical protein K8R48_00880 [Alphaproteobacteria bacterium]|nr:hypothetical protein [Alphaproteobacteria bacterium]
MKKDKQPKPDKKKRPTLREKFNALFKGLKWKDVKGISKETLKDMRSPKEIFTFAASSVVPGGWFGYAFYRVVKYRNGQGPSNDNPGPKNPPQPPPAP